VTRLDRLDIDDVPESYHHLFTDEYLGDRHIFRVWAHNPEVLEATLEYLNTLYDQLTPRTKELVILTVARARGARYEWHQHVAIAREIGIADRDILAIVDGDLDQFDTGDKTLIRYVLAVVQGTVDDESHDALLAAHGPETVVGVAALASGYLLVGRLLGALDIEPESPFVGWRLEGDE